MANKYLYTRDGDKEDVLHVGETGTVVGFRSDPGMAAALAEMRKLDGQAAIAKELSGAEFAKAKEDARKGQEEFEASKPDIAFKP